MRKAAVTLAIVCGVAAVSIGAQATSQDPVQTPAARATAIIQKVIVKVNGEIFTQSDLEQRQIEAVKAQPNAAEIRDDATLQKVINELTPRILTDAVDELILVQRGKELGYRMTEERWGDVKKNIRDRTGLDDAGIEKEVKLMGLSMTDYRNMMERQLIIDAVTRQEIIGQPNLTESEMRQYYETHPTEFLTPATVTLREIFVAVPTDDTGGQATVNAAADEAARAKITAARDRILKGEDIAAVVTEVSESGSKANGGLIGPIRLDDLNPDLRNVVEGLQAGQVTEPLRSARGYQLFKMESRTAAETEPFEAVREKITQQVLASRVDAETAKYLEKLRVQAVIEWKDDTYQKLYDQGRSARQASGQ